MNREIIKKKSEVILAERLDTLLKELEIKKYISFFAGGRVQFVVKFDDGLKEKNWYKKLIEYRKKSGNLCDYYSVDGDVMEPLEEEDVMNLVVNIIFNFYNECLFKIKT